jgi:4-hydroxythreonine-4-phosphate dehydrogenase
MDVIQTRSSLSGDPVPLRSVKTMEEAALAFGTALPVFHRPLPKQPEPGNIAPENAMAVAGLVEEAADWALRRQCAGIVTCPIQKETLYGAGFTFEGHTDYLAALAKRAGHAAVPVMMLVAGTLRTIPVTIHIPLKDVPAALSVQSIIEQSRIAAGELKARFGIASPRIGMTGLNPHAGEGGTIGMEETTIIAPAIRQLLSEGLNVAGPLPADTASTKKPTASTSSSACIMTRR